MKVPMMEVVWQDLAQFPWMMWWVIVPIAAASGKVRKGPLLTSNLNRLRIVSVQVIAAITVVAQQNLEVEAHPQPTRATRVL